MIGICLCASSAVFAADSVWTLDGDTQWTNTAAWSDGVPGAGDVAYFTNAYVDAKITASMNNDQSIVVGGIELNATRTQLPSSGTNLTLDASGGTPTINLGLARLDAQVPLDGTDGYLVYGTKTAWPVNELTNVLMIGATAKSISGQAIISNVNIVVVNDNNAFMNSDVVVYNSHVRSRKDQYNAKSITVNSGGTLGSGLDTGRDGVSFELLSPSITVNAGGEIQITALNTKTLSGSNITVNSGGEINFGGTWGEMNYGTYTLSNPLTLVRNGVLGIGALSVPGLNNLTNNGPITLTGSTRIGMWGGGDASMIMNGVISGTGPCNLIAQAGHSTHIRRFELHAANTYSGNTLLEGFACQNITKLFGDQRIPQTELTLQVHDWGPMDTTNTFDLNGYTQAVTKLTVAAGAGADAVNIVGGTGGKIYNSGVTDINGAFCDWQADFQAVNQQFQVNSGAALTIANSTIDVGDWGQLRPAWAGAAGATTTVNIDNGGKVVCYSLRVADINGTPIVNINSGGEVKCADLYVGNATALTAGKINIDGGTLSDSTVGYTQTNWIHGFKGLDLTVDVKAGGATFDIDNQYKAISEVISGVGDLTKTGTETLAFEVAPTLTGNINVNEGGLLVNCDMSSAPAINVAAGATVKLVGAAAVGDINLTAGSSFNPGSSFGTNTAGAIVMETGSSYEWEIGGGGADLVIATSLDISGATNDINVTIVGDIAATDTNMLFKLDNFVTFDAASLVNVNGVGTDAAEWVYEGNNILLTGIVPEPAIFGLLAIFGLAFFRRK